MAKRMRMLRLAIVLGLPALMVAPLALAGVSLPSAGVQFNAPPSIALSTPYTATFNGKYTPKAGTMNSTNATGGACYNAGVREAGSSCAVWFTTPNNFKLACTATGKERAGWGTYAPLKSDPGKSVAVELFWQGGGALEGTTVVMKSPPVVYHMHIQVADLCGDLTTNVQWGQSTDEPLQQVFELGRKQYSFSGYVDVI